MDYQVSFTVPANTAEEDAISYTLEIAPGIINLVYMQGRRGAAGLPKVRIYWGEKQLYPSSPDEWYSIDWTIIEFREHLIIYDYPYELTIKTYNEDEKYGHKVVVRVNVWPLELLPATLTTPMIVPTPWPELGG